MQYAQVALLCAQEEPADRPTMSDIVSLLNFQSISLLPEYTCNLLLVNPVARWLGVLGSRRLLACVTVHGLFC
jgi:hypothetical protein